MSKKEFAPLSPAAIQADSAYDLSALKRLGLGTAALRKARRNGLRVVRFGRKSYVLGRDLIMYLDENAATVDGDGCVTN